MSSMLETVSKAILEPSELDVARLGGFLDALQGQFIDAGDLYFQTTQQESWVLDDGILREGSFNIEKGVGIRAMSEEKTGFAYCDDLHGNAITQAVQNARAIVRQGQSGSQAVALRNRPATALYPAINPVDGRSAADKVELLKKLDAYTRSLDERIEQVIISLSGGIDQILVAATDDTLAADVRPLVRLNVTVLMHQGDRREQGSAGGGGRHSYDGFFDTDRGYELARDAESSRLLVGGIQAYVFDEVGGAWTETATLSVGDGVRDLDLSGNRALLSSTATVPARSPAIRRVTANSSRIDRAPASICRP